MADRFYCPDPPSQGRFTLDPDESRHLGRVRRLGVGDEVELFDGRGFATRARVVELDRDRAELEAIGSPLAERSAPCRITLATAVPKGERFDWLVEKATELGVARLSPIVAERSAVDPRGTKLQRLRRVIVEAAKQCGRSRLMELDAPSRWSALAESRGVDVRLVAHPGGLPPRDWPRVREGSAVTLAIGPEGGFTDAEVEAARSSGWTVVGLGATLLRVETAGLAGCSAILARCEGEGG